MSSIKRITGSLSLLQDISGNISDPSSISGSAQRAEIERLPEYPGPYEVTPSQQTQTIHASGMKLSQDIVVNPIPSNYGLVTWDGSTLTVS